MGRYMTPAATQGTAAHRAIDRDYHGWLSLHARQLADRVERLRCEQRTRKLGARAVKLLLDSLDELAETRWQITLVESGVTEREIAEARRRGVRLAPIERDEKATPLA